MTSVSIGSGITSIGEYAFYTPSLQNVSINVACDTYKVSFTNNNQFRNTFNTENIVWGTACTW